MIPSSIPSHALITSCVTINSGYLDAAVQVPQANGGITRGSVEDGFDWAHRTALDPLKVLREGGQLLVGRLVPVDGGLFVP